MDRAGLLREGRAFALFAAVGAAGFLVDLIVLKIGLAAGLGKPAARLISLALAMHFTFAVNRTLVFARYRGANLRRQWIMYLLANSAGALVNYGVFLALTARGSWLADAPGLAVAAGSISGLVVNFAGSRLLAFRR
jgi:putative flippase GtrA